MKIFQQTYFIKDNKLYQIIATNFHVKLRALNFFPFLAEIFSPDGRCLIRPFASLSGIRGSLTTASPLSALQMNASDA